MILGRITQALAKAVGASHYQQPAEMSERELCDLLDAYYFNNDLYLNIQKYLRDEGVWSGDLKPLRNPVYSAVEFYAMTIWPGALPDAMPIIAKKPEIVPAIQQIWKWSNWGTKKQWAARAGALYGDLFLKVETSEDRKRVYLKHVSGRNVTDFAVDERGVVKMLRYDSCVNVENGKGFAEQKYNTEIWDESGFRLWTHTKGFDANISDLGDPMESASLKDAAGIDFVPFVHAPFRDIGDLRGMPVVWPCLGKIDEMNRKATRLAQMMFCYNKPHIALRANSVDSEGRPLPAPRLNVQGTQLDEASRVTFGDDELLRLPGNSSIEFLVPAVNFAAHAELIASDLGEIERDMPEITFYSVAKQGAASGRALELQMGPAVHRVIEARGNFEAALIRANEMALTVAQQMKIDGFSAAQIGTYDRGDFDHSFAEREVIPLTSTDRAETVKAFVDTGVPLGEALVRYGKWSREDVNRVVDTITAAKTGDQLAKEKDAIQAEAVKQVKPVIDVAIRAISDAAISNLSKSGAIDAIVAAKASGK